MCLKMMNDYYIESIKLFNELKSNNVESTVLYSVLPQSFYIKNIEYGAFYDYYFLCKNTQTMMIPRSLCYITLMK